jgi:transposase InsO family protein
MSKARLVITAVVVEGRSQSAVAREYGVSQGWISRLVTRYRLEGEAAFEPQSRRPHTSPTRLPQTTIDLIVELRTKLSTAGLDAGPHTIAWHLEHHHQLQVSVASISRHLAAAGLVTPTPAKRPKSSYIRFAADQPNERWQADFTHWWLADKTHTEILTWLDDHSRYALSVTAHRRVTATIVLNTFRKAYEAHGIPASTLTDNGMVFTTRLAGGKGGRNQLENELRRLGVVQIKTPPPTTPPPAARSNGSNRPSNAGSPTNPEQRPCPSCKPRSTPSSTSTTTAAPTAPCHTAPPRPPPIRHALKQPREPASTPTTASAPTASTKPAPSPCAWAGACTTSASAASTTEPAS